MKIEPASTDQHSGGPRLMYFPVAMFATVMGLAGLTLVWQKAASTLAWPSAVGQGLAWFATAVFVLVTLIYAAKLVRHPAAVQAERHHPVKMNFVPSFSIAIILLATAWSSAAPDAAGQAWAVGAALHLVFTLLTMSVWIHHTQFEIHHLNPAWFIPVVGNIIVPVAGVKFASVEISWFFFSIGVVFWLPLFAAVLYRLFFHAPLAQRLTPTLFILLAPPSVGFLAYMSLTGHLDAFARILYYTALFLALLLASNALRFFRVPFSVSAWAYSFPLAALTVATLRMAEVASLAFFSYLAMALVVLTTLVIGGLALRTLLALARNEICRPD